MIDEYIYNCTIKRVVDGDTKQSVNGYLVSNYLAVKYFGQSKEDIKQQLIELRDMYKGHPIFGESQ